MVCICVSLVSRAIVCGLRNNNAGFLDLCLSVMEGRPSEEESSSRTADRVFSMYFWTGVWEVAGTLSSGLGSFSSFPVISIVIDGRLTVEAKDEALRQGQMDRQDGRN